MHSARTPRDIAERLPKPQQAALLGIHGDAPEACLGTWKRLRAAGVLDGNFDLTRLGAAVRTELQSIAASKAPPHA
jgi:hypothetical protein